MVLAAASQPLLAWLMEPVVRDVFMNRDQTMLVLVPLAIMSIMVVGGAANFRAVSANELGWLAHCSGPAASRILTLDQSRSCLL